MSFADRRTGAVTRRDSAPAGITLPRALVQCGACRKAPPPPQCRGVPRWRRSRAPLAAPWATACRFA